MNNTITERKAKSLKPTAEKLLTFSGVKAAAAAAFGFITALPIKAIGVSPFAVAAAAVMPRSWVFLCYLGGFFSYMTNSFYESAAPVSAMTAILLFRLIFKGKGKTVSDAYIAPIAVFLALTVTGILCGDIKLSELSSSMGWIGLSAVAAGSAFIFKNSVELYGKSLFGLSPSKLAYAAAAAFLLLLPLESVKVFGVSPLALAASAAALTFAVRLNGTEAFFTSAFFGAAWALGALRAEYFLILPACVMAARTLFPLGKLPCAAGFIALRFGFNLIFTPIVELLPQMIEVLAAAFILIIIPQRYLTRASLLKESERENTAGEYAADRIKETATLFRYLGDSIADVSSEVSKELAPTPESCVDHIRAALCDKCELTKFCSGVKRNEVEKGIAKYANDALNGTATAASLPRCAHLTEMENEIRSYMLHYNESVAETQDLRELSTDIYAIVSDALEDISTEIATEPAATERMIDPVKHVEIGCSRYKNEKEINSGDNCEYFIQGKHLFVIISDGMGSGKLASIDSGMTCRLLKRFLISGFSFATALKLANAALKLKGGDESFATADICRLDVESGEFSIAKAGAAASYLVSNNRVRRLFSATLPVGILNEARFDVISSKLKKGDCLIMVSDGALNNGDEWIENSRFYDSDVNNICSRIVKTGRESYGSSPADDITAVCVKLK
ncbi:MAG: SpoIIE family protein phosphatase [Clostridia bacterium]|nr:SpoIIE family protein phosphatase [Clostridia bacterium]